MKISFLFAWFDLWIGAYYNRASHTWYICPLPMCVIKIELSPEKWSKATAHIKPGWKLPKPPDVECDLCNKKVSIPLAYDTGEGWALQWECPDRCGCVEEYMDDETSWPFVEDSANAIDFEAAGFEIV